MTRPDYTYQPPTTRPLAVGLAVSVAAYALVLALLARVTASTPTLLADRVTADHAPIRLGDEASRLVTINWLGFPEPTPHEAPRSEIEQSELSPNARSAQASRPWLEPASRAAAAAADAVAQVAERFVRSLAEAIAQPAAEHQQPQPADTERADQPATDEGQGQPKENAGDQPALPSESEADAVALADPIEVRPGAVAVAEGIRITTRRARWTTLTRLTALPRNPIVEVEFGPDGRVVRAAFADGHATGYPDVDGPLLDAVHLWTAQGARIEALSRSTGHDTLTIRVRVILR